MNICIVNAFFPPHVSGSARLAWLLSEEFAKRGHNVVVLTCRIAGTREVETRGRTTVYRLPSISYPKIELLHNADLYYGLLPQNLKTILRVLKKHRINAVQTFGQFQDLTFMAVLASRMLGIPVALSIHVRMEHPRPLYNGALVLGDKTLVKHLVARRVNVVVALDKLMRDYTIERYDVPEDVIKFIPTAVDVERFGECDGLSVRKKHGLDRGQPLILSLGTISNYRSPIALIRALPSVLREYPDSKLLLVGAVYSDKPARLVEALGLEKSVVFTGKIDYQMIPSYLGACDIEGHDLDSGLGVGLASLEGMAAGKAVLSSAREDNFLDLRLQNWETIVLVRPGNVSEISDALIRLLSDERLRQRIGDKARAFVRTHFTLASICDRYEALYEEMSETTCR